MLWPVKGISAWYHNDTGMDIACPVGTPVIAIKPGKLLYSEFGHTPWGPPDHPNDTPGCILQLLDKPIVWKGKTYLYFWYAHLSQLKYKIRDGIDSALHVKAATILGHSGRGNNNPHLHFGILTHRAQGDGQYMPPGQVEKYLNSDDPDSIPILYRGKPFSEGIMMDNMVYVPLESFMGRVLGQLMQKDGVTLAHIQVLGPKLGMKVKWNPDKRCVELS